MHGELLSVDELLEAIRAVTAEEVQALAVELAAAPRSLVVVGPFERDVALEALGNADGTGARLTTEVR